MRKNMRTSKGIMVRSARLDSFKQRERERRKTNIRKFRRLRWNEEAVAHSNPQIRPRRRA